MVIVRSRFSLFDLGIFSIYKIKVKMLSYVCVCVFVFNILQTNKAIWRWCNGFKSHPTDWRSWESNLLSLLYKAIGLSTTRRLFKTNCYSDFIVKILIKEQRVLTFKALSKLEKNTPNFDISFFIFLENKA